jgi:hypothetical protein
MRGKNDRWFGVLRYGEVEVKWFVSAVALEGRVGSVVVESAMTSEVRVTVWYWRMLC